MQLTAVGGGHDGRRRTERLGEPRLERPELEEVEQPLDVSLVRADHQVVGELHRSVPPQHADLEVLAHPRLGLRQRAAQLRGQLVEVGEDPVEPAVGRDQLGRGLLADSGHTGQVVAGIATQGGVLGVLRRGDAGPLEDPGLVVQRVVTDATPVVEHLDVRIADELIGVAVTGDDDDLVAACRGLLGGGGDEIVGLEPDELAYRHAEGVEHLTHETHLLAQRVGCRLALSLVGRIGLVAECRLRAIEGDEHLVGTLLLHHVDEHRGEPEHGVGELPAGGGHVLGQGEERPVCQRVAVEQ